MPADDLVLNVRQVAGYPPVTVAQTSATLLMQLGLGGAYVSISPADLVSTALANGGDMAIGGKIGAQAIQAGSAQFSNLVANMLSAQKACIVDFAATWGTVGGVQIATVNNLSDLDAALRSSTVWSFNGRRGDVRLWIDDIVCAGGAPIYSPRFEGSPRACTPPPESNSSRLATTAYVQNALAVEFAAFAPIDSPNFSGLPTAPTAAQGTADGQLATTAFVANAVEAATAGVASFNGRTGVVTLVGADVTGAGGALLASPAFTGTPSAPTQPTTDNSTRLATTAFVYAVAAPLASPAFTGVPTAPTAPPSTSTTQLATTAFVTAAVASGLAGVVTTFNGRAGAVNLIGNDVSAAGGALLVSPAFTGAPTAPTAAPNTPTNQIATCAYVEAAVSTSGGVLTFNGRAGAVVLTTADVSGVGGALLGSPAFTGSPTAPTAGLGTNTTQLATCAFVQAAVSAATAGVASFNGRTGSVTLIATDVTAVLPASTSTPAMDGAASPGAQAAWSRGDHIHPTDTTRYSASNPSNFQTAAQVTASLANYLPLTGGTLTGSLNVAAGGIVTGQGGTIQINQAASLDDMYMILANSAGSPLSFLRWFQTGGQFLVTNLFSGNSISLNSDGSFTSTNPVAGKPGGGAWTATSDARIKTVKGNYAKGLDAVLQLQPVTFVYKGNDTQTADVSEANRGPKAPRVIVREAPFPSSIHYGAAQDGSEFIGLVAQDVEGVFPEMVTQRSGFIDGQPVSDLRDVNTTALTFALVNAVKTLAARLEILEQRIAA